MHCVRYISHEQQYGMVQEIRTALAAFHTQKESDFTNKSECEIILVS